MDLTGQIPAAPGRPKRQRTTALVCHRIGSKRLNSVEAIVHFFTQDPEGVATVTIAGSYSSKLPIIKEWRKTGIPEANLLEAFVGYNVLVDRDGTAYKTLPLDAKGAHAPMWNSKGVGIGFVGDFRAPTQLKTWERQAGIVAGDQLTHAQQETGRKLFRDLIAYEYPEAVVVTHDETLLWRGKKRKPCPGEYAEPVIKAMGTWAQAAARQIGAGRHRF